MPPDMGSSCAMLYRLSSSSPVQLATCTRSFGVGRAVEYWGDSYNTMISMVQVHHLV